MSIAAGSLTRKLQIEQRSDEKDAANQPLDNWIPFGRPVWGRPVGPNGMTVVRASHDGVPIAPGRYSWRIRFKPTVTADMRVNYKGLIFSIVDVRNDFAEKEYTDLVCELGGNNG